MFSLVSASLLLKLFVDVYDVFFVMAALWNRAGHYIFVLWFLSFFFLLFFLA